MKFILALLLVPSLALGHQCNPSMTAQTLDGSLGLKLLSRDQCYWDTTFNDNMRQLQGNFVSLQTNGVINVKSAPYNALGDGVNDDGPAINLALAGGNRKVILPCGTYLLNETLLIDSNTEVEGQGECTVLKRTNVVSQSPDYIVCVQTANFANRDFFRNRLNDCGVERLYFHDFVLDGELITLGPTTGMNGSELGLHLGAASDSIVERMVFRNLPQDAVYFRNGYGNRVTQSIFEGHNMIWGNGGGVNHEVTSAAAKETDDPIWVDHNTFYETGPAFCNTSQGIVCDEDADCVAVGGHCAGGGTVAISATSLVIGASPAALDASYNHIYLSNYRLGISANFSHHTHITNNTIEAVPSPQAPMGMSGRMRGIQTFFSPTRAINYDVLIFGNTITGDPTASSLIFHALNEQQGGIFVQGDSVTSTGMTIAHNTIRDFNLHTSEAALSLVGVVGGTANNNQIVNTVAGGAAIFVGVSSAADTNVMMTDNIITTTGSAATDCFQIVNATNSKLINNHCSGLFAGALRYNFISGVSSVVIQDYDPQTYALLPSTGVANGSQMNCSDCLQIHTCAAGGSGALARRYAAAWQCGDMTNPPAACAKPYIMAPYAGIELLDINSPTLQSLTGILKCARWSPSCSINITRASFLTGSVAVAGTQCAVGIWDDAGTTKIFDSGVLACGVASTVVTTPVQAAVDLIQGTNYRLCWTQSGGATQTFSGVGSSNSLNTVGDTQSLTVGGSANRALFDDNCTASVTPYACCTGAKTGTCTGLTATTGALTTSITTMPHINLHN